MESNEKHRSDVSRCDECFALYIDGRRQKESAAKSLAHTGTQSTFARISRGGLGGFLGMHHFHHKTKHLIFKVIFGLGTLLIGITTYFVFI